YLSRNQHSSSHKKTKVYFMKIKTIILILFIVLFSIDVFAETSFKAEVDKKNITTDEFLTFKIIITSTEKQLPKPEIEEFKGFNIVSSANSTTMSFFDKTGNKTILVYAFILTPLTAGKFIISPSTLKLKDQALSTEAIEITVTQGKAGSKPKKPKPITPQKPEHETEPLSLQYTL
ncbi:MAG: BatD family protein, partial [Candidatus Omnitrophota bacterium]|nr:BatD family protein [Candidatus Omnitrophota bacterium]